VRGETGLGDSGERGGAQALAASDRKAQALEMDIFRILFVLALTGLGLFLVQFIPMDKTVHRIFHGVVIFVVMLWLVQALGFAPAWWPRVH
jgi:hypothetical protein